MANPAIPPPAGLIVAATPIDPPVDGKVWAFHVVNTGTEAIDSVLLEEVDYEWGDSGGGSLPNLKFGSVAPGSSREIWRDDENAAELRTSLRLLLRTASGDRRVTAEFGKLYLAKLLVPIPVLGREGKPGHLLAWAPGELPPTPPPGGTVQIDDVGVLSWPGEGKLETVRWDGLVRVELLTTDEGPAADDVIWLLYGSDGKGCAVGPEQDPSGVLLKRLQVLPGFDNGAVIKAMASADNARFLVWERPKLK